MSVPFLLLSLAAAALAAELPSGLDRLEPGKSGPADLTRIAGEASRYLGERGTALTPPLPPAYLAEYDGWSALVMNGVIHELRFRTPQYSFRGSLRTGSTVAQAVEVLGAPSSTVKGQPRAGMMADNTLYLDIDGQAGFGYYARAELGVRVFFRQGAVSEIMVSAPRKARLGENTAAVLPRKPTSLPRFDPANTAPFQLDLRGRDLTALDLRERRDDLLFATFDDLTRWPAADRMPAGFDPAAVAALGREPGLGVRSLHQRGITGKNVAIAIIDNPLNPNHREYAGRVVRNEPIRLMGETVPHMHGAAVVSIAAGKTLGVAPGAVVHYFTNWAVGARGMDVTGRAMAVRRILEINRELPPERKIRVISMSLGWNRNMDGFDEMSAAAKEARDAGLLFVSSSMEDVHGFAFHGLGRNALADPEQLASFGPGRFWAPYFYAGKMPPNKRLMVPMDSRTTASQENDSAYVFYRTGGWSWSIPYIAGLYALAVQVRPAVTPHEFWDAALATARHTRLQKDGKEYEFGEIVDPPALIRRLEGGARP